MNARTEKALQSFEADAQGYELLATQYDETDPERADACRQMAAIIRGWKADPQSVARRALVVSA
jgi:hypothetical protein